MKAILEEHWHHLPERELYEFLDTGPLTGLDTFEVSHRKEQFGPNAITRRKPKHPALLFLAQFNQPLVHILLASAAITAFLREWVDASVIFGVVLVNAVIGFIQEEKAVKAIEALSRSLMSSATVLRGGERQVVPSEELVPGDVVLLQSGDKVPADLRLVAVRELTIDESALTGESLPVKKQSGLLPRETLLADRLNMAYAATLVTYGIATGIVVATGDQTEIGRINRLISSAELLATPLTRKIARFSNLLLYVILSLAAVTFVVGALRGKPLFDMFMAVVALAVGAIPEGLPAAVTITLAIGVARMARRNTIIRRLPAVETLGSTTVICSDKTGTLTRNQMTVREIHAGGDLFRVSGSGYAPLGVITLGEEAATPERHPALHACLRAGLLCNDAALTVTDGVWGIQGDPTEAALLAAARKGGLTPDSAAALPRLDAIPFEAQHQYMATLHTDGEGYVIYLKGAPERILPRCIRMLAASGGEAPLDAAACQGEAEQMARRGLRVLAFARLELRSAPGPLSHADVAAGLTFLGFQGMIDPPRDEAMAAVRACRSAGIQVKMITGDHAVTAAAVARQIGLTDDGDVERTVLDGRHLAGLSDAGLTSAVTGTAVFARVAPEQKLRLVEALQAGGHVVAMTGDGVNDAPALRRADIGVAMGLNGTEVAREAADMVLTDDNFSSIEAAVEEGRGVYDNLVKFITWTLPTNLGEGLVVLAAVFAGVELPILPVQILWINMTTAVLLGLMLAFEPKEPGIMQRPPRSPREPLLTGELMTRIVIVGVLLLVAAFGIFEWEQRQGSSVAAARTCAVNVFVMGELFYLFNCRSLRHSIFRTGLCGNRWLLTGVALMIGLQVLFTYLPAMQAAFGSRPLGPRQWGLIVGASAIVLIVIECEKWLRRRGENARPA